MSIQALGIRKSNPVARKRFPRLGIVVLFLIAAFIVGLISVTGNLILVGLVAGLIGGGFLLAKPGLAITGIIAVGLTMGALLSLAGSGFEKLSWAVSLLSFFLFIPAILHLGNRRHAPAFVDIAIAFVVIALGATLIQWASTGEVLRGIKHTFQAMGLFFALALMPLAEKDYQRWRKLLIFIVALQIPFALYEFFVLVPLRGGLAAGSAVTDVVAGTFGANLRGGSPNSVMALLLLMTLTFMFAHWKEGRLRLRYLIFGLPILLLPIGIGEVKVAFVLFPLMLIALFGRDISKRPGMFFGVIIMGSLVIYALGAIYVEFIMRRPLEEIIAGTLAYNFQSRGYGGYVLNRSTVLSFWWQHQGMHDPLGFFVGHGLGSSFTAEEGAKIGHVAEKWPYHGIDLTAASSLLWDTGVIGFALYLSIFAAAWRSCNVLLRMQISNYHRAEVSSLRAIVPLFAVFVFYSDAVVSGLAMQILWGLVLGYLAFLYRLLHGKGSARTA